MSGGSRLSHISGLIDLHLRPCAVIEVGSVSKEEEKNLLIALSKVFREIRLWTSEETDGSSDSDAEENPVSQSADSGEFALNSEERIFLAKIVGDLMCFLMVHSQHVQHLTSNVLSAISELLSAYGKGWGPFVHLLFVYAELSIGNIHPCSSVTRTRVHEDLYGVSESCSRAIKSKLQKANWSTVAGIFRVLRCIWKYLKQDFEDQLVDSYLNSLNSFISHIPWNLLDDANVGQKCAHLGLQMPKFIFLGYFTQLLSSVVEQVDHKKVQGGSVNGHQLLFSIAKLVPSLFLCCLGKEEEHDDARISLYFRHKLLMLMTRLSGQGLESSVLFLWLRLLHKYFQDLMSEQISMLEPVREDSLEGSPFSGSMFEENIQGTNLYHLKRQAIYLFIKCSLSLIFNEEEGDQQCECLSAKPCLSSHPEYCSHKKVLGELYKWLSQNLQHDTHGDSELYMEKCMHFGSSFIQLYAQEDDLLFKVLLEVLSIPIPGSEKFDEVKGRIPDSQENILIHLSNLFNPLNLFHSFLAEIKYDHQVLLDYLISKDMGISCAEYLLRCLRLISESWEAFLQFSYVWSAKKWSSITERKIFRQKVNFRLEPYSTGNFRHGHKLQGTRGKPFDKAKLCLLSLKYSVENLHQKNLFPYNPKVLLRRLTEFQELCFNKGCMGRVGEGKLT
ncbi:uncharacterized protein LOC115686581 isoform X1 [Syzygium oleosum]|uniref:uncharacterized protein LOC115686581 isoform X1 n=1 Tax=Syzygium oleosum TaxID=219896 RepID=UPI0011D274C9|nr:uncharacterized protein LOC115686581 isoform X1 [Syzygium oleosum]XP_056169762.1 uncharacterized protein LOC115686581 isoform X1 [Syzygium oleosum]XP_056169763.1 uncharacterized protein LOC115686581 isoform X1 [Syzygium oleosum]XP_056169764.1 uncharacterized protein LOC115686581 isoform X1 [Syzygium oleosum]